MKYRYYICDVFTDRPFTGNQLAVFPEAAGISDAAMQAIAREFNFPETTFVLAPMDAKNTARVRIFTPRAELPFAGHPTVGTAAVLAKEKGFSEKFILEEKIGLVPVELSRRGALVYARLIVEKPPVVPDERPDLAVVASSLSLKKEDVSEAWFASSGVAFCFARLKSKEAVDRAVLDRGPWSEHLARAWASSMYFFCGEEAPYVRMFSPTMGIDEDPATGSGAVALAWILATRRKEAEGIFNFPIDQGVAMGRPSRLEASAEKRGGRVVRVKVGGGTVITAEGSMEIA